MYFLEVVFAKNNQTETEIQYGQKRYVYVFEEDYPIGTTIKVFGKELDSRYAYSNGCKIVGKPDERFTRVTNGRFYYLPENSTGILEIYVIRFVNGVTYPKNNKKEKENKREKKMNFFDNMQFEFGKVTDNSIQYSIKGISVNGKAYNDGEIFDVTGMTISGVPLFKMPVTLSDVQKGDVIFQNEKYLYVQEVRANEIYAIDIEAATAIATIPVKNVFGFNYVTKIVNPFGDIAGTANKENPFGMLPMMMMMQEDDSEKDSLFLLMTMMSQGNNSFDFSKNPLMLMALMGDKKKDNLGMFMMMSMMANNGTTPQVGQFYQKEKDNSTPCTEINKETISPVTRSTSTPDNEE